MLSKENHKQLSKFMEANYISSEEMVRFLDKGIEMLFFIEEDTFERKDIQNVVFAIKGVIRALREE